jgi:hypothetical protein
VLDRTHTIFIVAKTANQSPWARAGLLLDAAFNLRQQYHIDDHRSFLMSLPTPDDTLGQQMGLAFPDTFAGFAYIMNFRYFRPISDSGQQYAMSFAKPANAALFGQSKLRRHVLVGDLRMSETNRLVQKAYAQDGFANSALLETTVANVTYPKLDADFFGKLLDSLEATPNVIAAPPPPASQPIASEPPKANETDASRMLNLAKSLAEAHQPDAARAKLKDLLAKFPDDPAAVEAKSLLADLEKQ